MKLEAALTPVIQTGQDQGWEETTDAGLYVNLENKIGIPCQGAKPPQSSQNKPKTKGNFFPGIMLNIYIV